ncbi:MULTISPECIES: HAD family hydrolase [Brucella]|jgi:HAD superfamily hydrolase (TIGR01509 family)|uniref:HAD family hydrolase n=2 Tax=Brucella TaxID=234 RepID=UPI000685B5D9|nr:MULTISPECIES: HAD family hydrolase [Brucella/Ochrobactrum group]MBA8862652.1 HAD superfamily hydrolase (TIGR01509 family) [Brucella anthropi]MDG9793395.1 HAD family hydrolase [Brucella anthropi]MDH0583182.1 HAD family hydrolase [Brucella anthropi]MDH0819796.1 HAD family hydrolase [Brucella anthropi]MDH2086539.1 HAD family hydrolase [Brucella anthropi]
MVITPMNPASLAFDLVIFDCDGVLVDSEIISCGAVADVLSRHGVPTDLNYALRTFLGRPASAVTDAFTEQTNKPLPDTFVSSWREYLFTRFEQELVAVDGILSAIEAIPLPRCVASSSDEERLQISLGRTGLLPLFEGNIFSTTMVRHGKPAPDLFLYAARQMDVSAPRCVVVEDSPSGVKAAKAAGMTAVGFTGGSHYSVLDNTETLLNAGADHILKRAADLPSLLREISADGR